MSQPLLTIIADQKPLVTICDDGKLIYGEGYTPDAAASAFWKALAQQGVLLHSCDCGKHDECHDDLGLVPSPSNAVH